MQAIPNKIVIGDESEPILTFDNSTIESVSEESAVSLIGDELFIDQFVPVLKYEVFLRYVFAPSNYDRFKTADGLILCSKYNYDLRGLPYGTPIHFYSNNRICGEFFSENVERVGKDLYKVNAVSAIGLMDRQRSKGGIYTGQRFDTVLREIVGDEYEYTINEDVAKLQVYGWLPHTTRRRNLHQLLMAYGVTIVRNDNGGMLFTYLANSTPQEIPSSRIYQGGKVAYDEPASRVEVVEHTYHYLASTEEEILFDNATTNSDAVTNAVITFDKPVYPDSLRVEGGGSLKISSSGVNYAVVSGVGVLVGKPYVHTTRLVSMDNEDAVKEKVVRVEDATLVTLANSENVLTRVAEYYFNATTVENAIIVETEKCGRRFTMENAFHEYTSGFISKMSTSVSSIKKAVCEIIQDYIPKAQGSAYTNVVVLPAASGTWTIPQAVFDKTSPNIRVVLIGGGEDGKAGSSGANGKDATTYAGGKGGIGGLGGLGGAGGKVYSTSIDCKGITKFTYGRSGKNTYFSGGGHSLNSNDGVSSETGFLEMFSGTVYALPGNAGQTGGAGGEGGYYPHNGEGVYPEAGEDVTHNGYTYSGGAPGERRLIKGSEVGITSYMSIYVGAGGGSGAAVGSNGKKGNGGLGNGNADGAPGVNGANGDPAASVYGNGGNGGHGGSGGGGGGITEWWNPEFNALISKSQHLGGIGGAGGEGSAGYQGCVIIYY